MTKTYAMFDVIGIKAAFKRGEAAEALEGFWNAADAWATSGFSEVGQVWVLGQHATQAPDPFVRTYSDSALLYTGTEVELRDFYRLVLSLKKRIDSAAGDSYVIINRDDEVAAPRFPALGGILMGSDHNPRYVNLAGSGPAFVNLFGADEALKQALRKKQIDSGYRIYSVGDQSVPQGASVQATVSFTGHNKASCLVHAIG